MSNIIQFPNEKKMQHLQKAFSLSPKLEHAFQHPPKTRDEYLKVCKNVLEIDDYKDILAGIMDIHIYTTLDTAYQKIIDCYYSYPN